MAISDRESTLRNALMAYFPMFIAVLSLVTSMYNGYLNNRFLDFIERNTGRVEYMHTCKEIIDAYFQVKLRAGATGDRAGAQREVETAVSRFAALATYLANLRDETARARYTELSRDLGRVAQAVGAGTSTADVAKLFEAPDRIFAELNSDCVKRAKDAPM